MKLNLIVATALNMGIGSKGTIPWHIKKDMAIFAKLTKFTQDSTKNNAVIMGRKTWESIPEKNKPLPNRLNIVLSSTQEQQISENLIICKSLDSALQHLQVSPLSDRIENVWIIGGASVYKEAMEHSFCHRIYITRILKDFDCDVFMPSIDPQRFVLSSDPRLPEGIQEENEIPFKFEVYEKTYGSNN